MEYKPRRCKSVKWLYKWRLPKISYTKNMNDLLDLVAATPDMLTGSSALIPTACTPSTGPANVDGRCIMGGRRMPSGRRGYTIPSLGLDTSGSCVAFPIYLATNVPYTNGRVAGSNYSDLANMYTYTNLNQQWATSSN